MSQMRIIVLSSPGYSLRRGLVLKALAQLGVPVEALVLSSFKNYFWKNTKLFWRRVSRFGFDFLWCDLLCKIKETVKIRSDFEEKRLKLSPKIIKIPSFKNELGIKKLKELAPDLMVLAGVEILPEAILAIPRLGTLNGHLGWAPDYKGNYTVYWALYQGKPVGVTIHWVDQGIDTGPILRQKIINPPDDCHSLAAWQRAAEKEAAEQLALVTRDVVSGLITPLSGRRQKREEGRVYQYMPPRLQAEMMKKLQKESLTINSTARIRKVLITAPLFPPEAHPSAVMIRELAAGMARRGWQVTVAAGYPYHPYQRLYPGYQKKWLKIESQDGFRVVRGWHLIPASPSLAARGLLQGSQAAAYFISAAASPRPQVVISYGPPLLGPLVSAAIAGIARARLVTVIYDIYPDIAIDLGVLKHPILTAAARAMERLTYRVSDRIVVLSAGFRSTLIEEKGVAPDKVAVIPVWLDRRDIEPGERDNPWRRQMGIGPDKFVVLYSGTIGLVSGAEVVVAAAQRLASYPDLLFVLVGAGHAKERVAARAREAGLENLRFFPLQPREQLSQIQAAADVSLVTLGPGRGKTSVPSKVLGYMAAARPIIAAVDGDCDTADLIRRAGCGRVVPPGDGDALAQAILYYRQNPGQRESAGRAGRQYFLGHLEKDRILAQYLDFLENLTNS
jgi:colanic acid biosynthesis glycosyl transferase WcaI